VTLVQIVENVAARLAWICDELEPLAREQALTDLEDDVASWLAECEALRAA
jgi:hypothetical protein